MCHFSKIVYRSKLYNFLEAVEHFYTIRRDFDPECFNSKTCIDEHPDNFILFYADKGVEIVILAVESLKIDFHLCTECLKVDSLGFDFAQKEMNIPYGICL